jgi:ferredoxin, 2Fe-2S
VVHVVISLEGSISIDNNSHYHYIYETSKRSSEYLVKNLKNLNISRRRYHLVKILTIGSLKYDRITSSFSMDQAVNAEKANVIETNRVIEIKQNQRYFQLKVNKGKSILDAALEQNLSVDYKCKQGTCGKCKVKLVSGNTYLQPANSLEEKKLHHLIQSGFRLACQAIAR